MKKWWIGILTAAMVLSVGATSVFADASVKGQNFVDDNGDGVCDVVTVLTDKTTGSAEVLGETAAATMRWANENGQNYVDADGDGVCDNYGTGNGGNGNGQNGQNYVDADSDGVCDNYANRPQDGTGRKHGGCKGRGC